MRIYLEKLDPKFKPAVDKAIDFLLKSQYPLGGWPQRWPTKVNRQYNFSPSHQSKYFDKLDYTNFYTFGDGSAHIIWNNIQFLIQCYITLGEERFLDPIMRGMNFYLLTQGANPQAGWAQQYNKELKPAHGRQYEPASLLPGDTYRICMLLMKFFFHRLNNKNNSLVIF